MKMAKNALFLQPFASTRAAVCEQRFFQSRRCSHRGKLLQQLGKTPGRTWQIGKQSWHIAADERRRQLEVQCAKESRTKAKVQQRPPSNAIADIEKFVDWLDENGVNMDRNPGFGKPPQRLAISLIPGRGRGLIALENIREYELLMSIPDRLLIRPDTTVYSLDQWPSIEDALPDLLDEDDGLMSLAIFIFCEMCKGDQSFWAPYIRVLPDFSDSPAYWDQSDRDFLEGTAVLNEINRIERRISEAFQALSDSVFTPQPSVFPKSFCTLEKFRLVYFVVLGRALRLQLGESQPLALVPFLDMMNHNPGIRPSLEYKKQGWLAKAKTLNVFSDQRYAKDDEVLITYGDMPDHDLLIKHGFLVFPAMNKTYPLTLQISPSDPLFPAKLQALKELGFRPVEIFTISAGDYPQELFNFQRIAVITDPIELTTAVAKVRISQPISIENEVAVGQGLLKLVENLLSLYPTSMSQDDQLLSADPSISGFPEFQISRNITDMEIARASQPDFKQDVIGGLTLKQRFGVVIRRLEKKVLSTFATAILSRLDSLGV